MNELRIIIIVEKIWLNVIYGRIVCVCMCVCVCVCGWSCLKLISVGFGRYREELKLIRLVKFEVKYDEGLLISD